MYNEDNLRPSSFHPEPRISPSAFSGAAQSLNEAIIPAELLDSGFEWTEILTTESKH
jgi:hypothetical protein